MEYIGKSLVQHGESNKRIYLMKLNHGDYPGIVNDLINMAKKNNYTKVFAKVPEKFTEMFTGAGFIEEAFIPEFYNGAEKALFLSYYLDKYRKELSKDEKSEIEKNIQIAKNKAHTKKDITLKPQFSMRRLTEEDAEQLTKLYKVVFETYPFPIHDPEFIKKTMKDYIIYYGIFDGEKLIAASSAETDDSSQNAEMTDFATYPDYRGHSFANILLEMMENDLSGDFKTLYTIARSFSAGMNITFARAGYIFTGTLINNTNISGRIESMNVWYKRI